mgnify:CR=1 FL=1
MNCLEKDLDYIFTSVGGLWEELRGKQLFITGGTGFFGSWLLESLVWANDKLNLGVSATVLTRDPASFKKKMPHLAGHSAIKFHVGDVRNFDFPEGQFTHIFHAATTSAVATFNNFEDPLMKFDTIVGGTRRVLDFALKCHAQKFFLTSTGAVYGKQHSEMTHMREDYCGTLDCFNPNFAVGEGKRVAEFLCAHYSSKYGIETKVARCFSFLGPYLPLDIHYAVGNFIRDAISGGPIIVNGDGSPRRSYLYAADLMIWLWTILFNGKSCRVYNVGSEKEITIKGLADLVAQNFQNSIDVKISKFSVSSVLPDRYIPSTERARTELGLKQTIDIEEAIKRTIIFIKNSTRV